MNIEEFRRLPELVSASDVRALLGIVSNRDWAKVKKHNPKILHRIPGMTRDKYLRDVVITLLPQGRQ